MKTPEITGLGFSLFYEKFDQKNFLKNNPWFMVAGKVQVEQTRS